MSVAVHGAFATLLVLNVLYLARYAVDIPSYDDWEQIFLFDEGATVAELFEVHNEHHVLLTRLQILLHFHLDGWNVYAQQMVNLLIYLAGVVWLTWFLAARSSLPAWVVAAFSLFLLSPRLYDNHLWAFQGQFHFGWILDLVCISLLFRERLRLPHALAACACAFLATWSFSGGMAGAAALAVTYLVFEALRFARSGDRRRLLIGAAGFLAPTAASIALWIVWYAPPALRPPPSTPFGRPFWSYFLSLISHAFALETRATSSGLVCLVLVVLPLLALGIVRRSARDAGAWAVVASGVSVLAMLAAVAFGRGGYGLASSKASRYAELAGLLVPLTAVAWGLFAKARPALRSSILPALWLLCFLGYRDEWQFRQLYEPIRDSRQAGVACVERYYYEGGDGLCPDIWWPTTSMDVPLEFSRALDLSFYRKIRARRGRDAAPRPPEEDR